MLEDAASWQLVFFSWDDGREGGGGCHGGGNSDSQSFTKENEASWSLASSSCLDEPTWRWVRSGGKHFRDSPSTSSSSNERCSNGYGHVQREIVLGENAKPLNPARQVERDVNKQDVSSTSKTTNQKYNSPREGCQPAARRVKLTLQSVGRMTLDAKSHQSQPIPPFQVTS